MKETDEQYRDRTYLLKLIFEYQERESISETQIRRLEKALSESQKVVTMRREQVNNLKKANKSLKTSNDFYIGKEKDNQGFC
jgi:hypothetical protein